MSRMTPPPATRVNAYIYVLQYTCPHVHTQTHTHIFPPLVHLLSHNGLKIELESYLPDQTRFSQNAVLRLVVPGKFSRW